MVSLAARLDRTLSRAAPPPAWTDASGWSAERDRWRDLVTGDESLSAAERRALIVFLGDASPSRASRMTAGEWRAEVDALTTELLSAS